MEPFKKYNNANPEKNANPISKLLFLWTMGIFWKGYKKDLDESDMYDVLDEDKTNPLREKLEEKWNEELKKEEPSLQRAIIKTIWKSYAIWLIIAIINNVVVSVLQAILLGKVIQYFTAGTTLGQTEAQLYGGGLIVFIFIRLFMEHHYYYYTTKLGIRVRVACSSLIYRKLLRLSKSSTDQTATGRVVNIMSNDVSRFDLASNFLGYVIVAPIQIVVITYFLWYLAGPSALVGLAFYILQTIPVQIFLSKSMGKLRQMIAVRTDNRMRLMNEIVSGIQVIKMYTWEMPFAKLVADARRREMQKVTYFSYIRGFYISALSYLTRTTLFVALLCYSLSGFDITPQEAFSMAQFFFILNRTVCSFFTLGMELKAETSVSIKRIQELLMEEETEFIETNTKDNRTEQLNGRGHQESNGTNSTEISILNGSARWGSELVRDNLSNITFRVPKGKLCAIIGQIGSGKSSLLHAIMKELPLYTGSISVGGSISYASQEPWMFVGTVRQNILFGQPYREEKYTEVVRICALQKDFDMFPYGDESLVGEKGISLSGGQRARINLARAVYQNADIYLLDDPLSAVDTHVGKHLFEECIKTHLGNKTRILVTHQLQYVKDADLITILNNGKIECQGTFAEIQQRGFNFAKILTKKDSESDVQKEVQLISSGRSLVPSGSSSVDKKPKIQKKKGDSNEIINLKGNSKPRTKIKILRKGSKKISRKLRNILATKLDLHNYPSIIYTVRASKSRKSSDTDIRNKSPPNKWFGKHKNKPDNENVESRSSGAISWRTYWQYFRSGGSLCYLFWTVFMLILAQVSTSAVDLWVAFWTNEEVVRQTYREALKVSNESNTTVPPGVVDHTKLDKEHSLIIYGVLAASCMFITLLRSTMFIKMCMKASVRLHNTMFVSILRSTMRFFNINPSGRILNRFSQDIGQIDEFLPRYMLYPFQAILAVIGIFINIVIVNPYFLIPLAVLSFCFYWSTTIYLHTSRNVKRLEGIFRSPVYSHISDTMNGLITIRAFRVQEMVQNGFDSRQDDHTTATTLFHSTSCTFRLWMDILCSLFIAIMTVIFFFLEEQIGANVGLALSQALMATDYLPFGLLRATEVVGLMTSVERVLEYINIEKEPPLESAPDKKPDPSWPSKGAVEFDHLYLKYAENQPHVLKNLHFKIEPTHKIGIVGRTGAGKSSLISALFRLAKLDGAIKIDDVNTNDLGLHDLRSRISIIPQEPVLFSESLRHNLDPFDQYPDDVLWDSLEEVDLKAAVSGLDMQVQEGGSNFSVGQRQLICLARAILRNNKILVLDEATANVDPETDTFVQETIRRKFKYCTVLTIAHRLNTIMDSDRVLVMDSGSMVEYDHPHTLLQNRNGYFYKLVQETGPAMADQLNKIADEAYRKISERSGTSKEDGESSTL